MPSLHLHSPHAQTRHLQVHPLPIHRRKPSVGKGCLRCALSLLTHLTSPYLTSPPRNPNPG
ncbi:hypothetical protein P167DRAFT_535507 [Morchella conica CCBAS932]|uniref:Uncharacterized protein n=1 Tax=Morchella conica CCBAS932 TaxID=1392247 RepID=A0A3N4KQA7_9PEZI|nr:hypothetical protein P167DRAFT_535507 [Morchella conica CCBAS932]